MSDRPSLIGLSPPWWFYAILAPFAAVAVVLYVAPEWRIAAVEYVRGPQHPLQSDPVEVIIAKKKEEKKETPKLEKPKEPLPTPKEEKTELAERPKTAVSSTKIGVLPAGPDALEGTLMWPNRKAVTYGERYKDAKSLARTMRVVGIQLGDEETELFKTIPDIPSKQVAITVQVMVSELGFDKPVLFSDLMLRAAEKGLRPVPLELIPQYAIGYNSKRKLFFATQVASEDYKWRASLAVVKYPDEPGPRIVLRRWDGIYARNFEKQPPFDPLAVIVFTLPD